MHIVIPGSNGVATPGAMIGALVGRQPDAVTGVVAPVRVHPAGPDPIHGHVEHPVRRHPGAISASCSSSAASTAA